MARSFNGIDPYLEAQGYWRDFHNRFLTYCAEFLADALPANYEARIDEQMTLLSSGVEEVALRKAIPDVGILRSGPSKPATTTSGIATLEPVTVELPVIEETREAWVEVYRHPGRELVTVIELLSPSNKELPGRELYLAKRSALLIQDVHLVELDLLLGGQRLPMRRPLPRRRLLRTRLSRTITGPQSHVYFWQRDDRLPKIPVPLKSPDPDVVLDLAAVYKTAYDRGRYANSIDYTKAIPGSA